MTFKTLGVIINFGWLNRPWVQTKPWTRVIDVDRINIRRQSYFALEYTTATAGQIGVTFHQPHFDSILEHLRFLVVLKV